jgi:hypothetical protein
MTSKEACCLAIFAHKQRVLFAEYLYLGHYSKAKISSPAEAIKILKTFLRRGWLKRLYEASALDEDYYILEENGDLAFREHMIKYGADELYYHNVQQNDINSMRKWSGGKNAFEVETLIQRLAQKPQMTKKDYDMIKVLQKQKNKMEDFVNKYQL